MNTPSALSNPHSAPPPELSSSLDGLFHKALLEKLFSGASLAVAFPDRILFERNWGSTLEGGTPVDVRTLFDLASLTKPLVTASLCIWAVGSGLLDLEDRLERFLPKGLLPISKREISVRHLLNHASGLPPHAPFYLDLIDRPRPERREVMLQSILELPLGSPPGQVSRYSDLGFILLGILMEELLGAPLDVLTASALSSSIFSRDLVYRRLSVGTDPTVPPGEPSASGRAFAATEDCPWRRRLLVGEVHDENAYCLDGVAGHAGLFGTASGVVGWLRWLWGLYRGDAPGDPWSPSVVREFWDRSPTSPDGTWVLGFDTPTPSASSAGSCVSPRSVGHLGFTGTSFWLDLEREIVVVLLTNRVYPSRGNDRIKAFRPMVHDLVMRGIHGA
jgi:CubicO group peptidase (beta-lactamase class C family)